MIIPHVSASQWNTFTLCKRRWYYEKVLGFPRGPVGAGAIKGSKHHKEIEAFLKTGIDGRTGVAGCASAIALLKPYHVHAPFNVGGMVVEADVASATFRTPGGIKFKGAIDLYLPGRLRHDGIPVIIDHKFKSNLAEWGETPEGLKNDPQFIIYGAYALTQEPDAPAFRFIHHQHETKGKAYAEEVIAELDRASVMSKFSALCADIDTQMTHVANCKTPDEVEGNQEACQAFRKPCDYSRVCSRYAASFLLRTPTLAVTAVNTGEKTMSLLDEMIGSTNAPTPAAEIKPKESKLKIQDVASEAPVALAPTNASVPGVELASPNVAVLDAGNPSVGSSGVLPPDSPEPSSRKRKRVAAATVAVESVPNPPMVVAPVTQRTLYIDCSPNTPYTDLNRTVYDVAQRLAAEAGLRDIREPSNNEFLKFGAWKGALAYEVANEPTVKNAQVAFINSNGLNESVVDVLRATFPVVVRVTR